MIFADCKKMSCKGASSQRRKAAAFETTGFLARDV